MANSGPGPNPPPGSPPGSPPPGQGPVGGPAASYPAAPEPAGPPPAANKNSPLVILALGCGLLLVLGGIAAAIGAYLFTRNAKHVMEQLPEIASNWAPPPSAIPVVPAPIPVEPTPVPTLPAGGAPAVAAPKPAPPGAVPTASAARPTTAVPSAVGSPAASAPAAPTAMCLKAAACCRTVVNRSPGGVSALAGNCDGLKALNDAVCERQLETYRQGARLLGATCD